MAKKLTQEQNAKLNGLAQAETAGKITKEQKIVLDSFRASGEFPKSGSVQDIYKESSDKMPEVMQLLGRLGFDVGGGIAGRKAGQTIIKSLAKATPAGRIGSAVAEGLGSFTGDATGQVVAEGRNLDDVSLKESSLSFAAPPILATLGQGLKAPGAIIKNKLFGKLGGSVKHEEATDRIIERTARDQTALPVAALMRNNAISIAYSIAREAPFASSIIGKAERSIDDVYRKDINSFISQFQSTASRLESGEMLSRLLKDAAGTISDIKGKSVSNLQTVMPDIRIDLTSVGGKANGTLDDLVEMSEKVDGVDLLKLKEKALKEISDEYELLKIKAEGVPLESLHKDVAVMFSVMTKNSEMYAGTAIKNLIRTDPEVLIKTLLASGRPKTVDKAMSYLSKAEKDQVAQQFLGRLDGGAGLITKSTTSVGSMRKLDGNMLLDNMDDFLEGNPAGMIDAFLGKGGSKTLTEMGIELAEIASTTGSAAGSTAVFLAGPGAVRGIVAGGMGLGAGAVGAGAYIGNDDPWTGIITIAGGLTILLGPRSLSKFLVDREVGLRLLRGVKKVENDPIKTSNFVKSFIAQMGARGLDATLIEGNDSDLETVSGAGSHQMTQ
tara:strand:+ start:1684 stop:3513 length:1830 start_codon:yes stop_codon:yes gene_type:complete